MSKSNILLPLTVILMISSILSLIYLKFHFIFQESFSNFLKSEVRAEKADVLETINQDNQNQKTSPSSIYIKSINLSLPISPGIIEDNQWTLYEDRVSWLSTSGEPASGNVILYAHNKPSLFGNLKNLKIGDEIEVSYKGIPYKYEVFELIKVQPDDVESVLSTERQITLYTCDGSYDQKRLIVLAKPKN